jgi:hypothetical protein
MNPRESAFVAPRDTSNKASASRCSMFVCLESNDRLRDPQRRDSAHLLTPFESNSSAAAIE